jgi:hypothetical protein
MDGLTHEDVETPASRGRRRGGRGKMRKTSISRSIFRLFTTRMLALYVGLHFTASILSTV